MSARVKVIDSHTEGEPTRLVLTGGPTLRGRTVAEQAADLANSYHDFRMGLLLEPRGSDVWVGALLVPPTVEDASIGVIFFNNVGVLGMCGHGTMGVVASLADLGRLQVGEHVIDTPVGPVSATLRPDGAVTVLNVRSYRLSKSVQVAVPGYGTVVGDIAYGGNWFFLVGNPHVAIDPERLSDLTVYATAIKNALRSAGITGAGGAEIDHIELFGRPKRADADSKNFVLCPGNAYDRSPCGTGTSAKLACLAADGALPPGQVWRQESIIGTKFEGTYTQDGDGVLPHITGRAYITAESTLLFDPSDPFRAGIPV
ncbi:MAG TPA: proline racemase family protein [Fimbriimonadaceae bacterium]|nr:proline racemase family protein [Fimbriimonadaceae bacterium]